GGSIACDAHLDLGLIPATDNPELGVRLCPGSPILLIALTGIGRGGGEHRPLFRCPSAWRILTAGNPPCGVALLHSRWRCIGRGGRAQANRRDHSQQPASFHEEPPSSCVSESLPHSTSNCQLIFSTGGQRPKPESSLTGCRRGAGDQCACRQRC